MKTGSALKVIEERGPNSGPVRIRRNGDKVERPPGERRDMLLRRGVKQIIAAEKEFREKTWWVRWAQMNVLRKSRLRALVAMPAGKTNANAIAARIAAKYDGVVDLEGEQVDFDLGMIVGKLSALRWVLGYKWECLDTMNPVNPNTHPHRTEVEIHVAVEECFEKVWWDRRQVQLEMIAAGQEPERAPAWRGTAAEIARIEEKYGVDNLGWDDLGWGHLNGKFSALRWVRGSEWDFLGT